MLGSEAEEDITLLHSIGIRGMEESCSFCVEDEVALCQKGWNGLVEFAAMEDGFGSAAGPDLGIPKDDLVVEVDKKEAVAVVGLSRGLGLRWCCLS